MKIEHHYTKLRFWYCNKTKTKFEIRQKVTYVKLTLSGGDTVAEGNPSNENELKQ